MRFLAALAVALLLAACGSSPTAPTAPPTIRVFTADRLALATGEQTTLRWTVEGVPRVYIDSGTPIASDVNPIGEQPAIGSKSISPKEPVNVYRLLASNDGGHIECVVRVIVSPR